MSAPIRPYAVGQEGTLVVGMRGVIEAIANEHVTIGGIALPTRLDAERGVRYLSMTWPEGDETTCAREHCDQNGCEIDPEEDVREELESLVCVIETTHYDSHTGPFRFCADPICKQANE